jgi:hypothetical protein
MSDLSKEVKCKNCKCVTIEVDRIEREIRKTLQDMDVTHVFAVHCLMQGFNCALGALKNLVGDKGLVDIFNSMDDHQKGIMDFCFSVQRPIQKIIEAELKRIDDES